MPVMLAVLLSQLPVVLRSEGAEKRGGGGSVVGVQRAQVSHRDLAGRGAWRRQRDQVFLLPRPVPPRSQAREGIR